MSLLNVFNNIESTCFTEVCNAHSNNSAGVANCPCCSNNFHLPTSGLQLYINAASLTLCFLSRRTSQVKIWLKKTMTFVGSYEQSQTTLWLLNITTSSVDSGCAFHVVNLIECFQQLKITT